MHEMLLEELRQFEQETLRSLRNKSWNDQLKSILEAELADIRSALKKMENGNFGLCELSGEFLPDRLLELMPTVKTMRDVSKLSSFFRKPIRYHS